MDNLARRVVDEEYALRARRYRRTARKARVQPQPKVEAWEEEWRRYANLGGALNDADRGW